jgi:ferredoxin
MVIIDKKKCIGCGTCESLCSKVFELGDDGKAKIKSGANEKDKCVKDAINSCPVEAIKA